MYNIKIPTALILLVQLSFGESALLARDPIRLMPAYDWVMQYEDDSCRLVRRFGSENSPIILTLSRYGPGDQFNFAIAGEPVRLRKNNAPLRLQFGRFEDTQKLEFFPGSFGSNPALVGKSPIRITPLSKTEKKLLKKSASLNGIGQLPLLSKHRYAAANFIKVSRQNRFSFVFDTGSLRKPFAAMDDCVDQMMAQWGVDTQKHETLSRHVKLKGRHPRIEYPLDMLLKGQSAIVQFRLGVDAEGNASSCHIQKTTRPKEFDDAVCNKLVRRAKFEPALDADGNPIASFWRSSVRFEILENRKSGGPD